MSPASQAEVAAIRRSVGVSRHDSLALFRIDADAGLAALEKRVATNLELREAQFRAALALDDAGRPVVDLLVGVFRGTLQVLASTRDPALLVDSLGLQAATRADEDHVIFGIDGPFAWELLGGWDTPTAIGLPYLAGYTPRDGLLVVRAGRTGEYGYLLIVPRAEAPAVWTDLCDRAAAMAGAVVHNEALLHCSFENWVFEISRDGAFGLDALELQLTWRLDLHKEATGLDAIRAHRASGLRRRITAITSEEPVAVGDAVRDGTETIGQVIAASARPFDQGHNAVAVLNARFAQVGLTFEAGGHPVRTTSAPFVLNRSLFVNPQRHAFATRAEIELPEGLSWPDPTSS